MSEHPRVHPPPPRQPGVTQTRPRHSNLVPAGPRSPGAQSEGHAHHGAREVGRTAGAVHACPWCSACLPLVLGRQHSAVARGIPVIGGHFHWGRTGARSIHACLPACPASDMHAPHPLPPCLPQERPVLSPSGRESIGLSPKTSWKPPKRVPIFRHSSSLGSTRPTAEDSSMHGASAIVRCVRRRCVRCRALRALRALSLGQEGQGG